MEREVEPTRSGSAAKWGPLWGARPADWSINEERQLPAYEEALRRVRIEAGGKVLDIGCGTGVFLRLATERGADAYGLDASERLLEVARTRVPEADLRSGEMESLPYDDGSFDLVTGFNSFFFAADMVAALGEAARVAKQGAPVLIQVWGDPTHNDLEAMKVIVRPFFPPPPPDAPPPAEPPALWREGVLESIAAEAGLAPETSFELAWESVYPDAETLGRAMVAPAGIAELVGAEREGDVKEAILAALEPNRRADGSYRLCNQYRYLVARA